MDTETMFIQLVSYPGLDCVVQHGKENKDSLKRKGFFSQASYLSSDEFKSYFIWGGGGGVLIWSPKDR
mgnify:CR=1 FL=1